jgi:SAM-dependent methyltransferase
MIQGVTEIRDAYRNENVAANYVDRRFREPLGALLHRRQADALKQVIRSQQPERVLEIAPGPARLTVEIAPLLGRRLCVMDASPQMLAEAERRLNEMGHPVETIAGDAFALPMQGPFDLVYSFRLIRHFERQDRLRLYRQIASRLRRDGLLVFDAVNEIASAPLRARAKPGQFMHYDALLSPDGLTAELGEAGFELVSLTGVQHRYPLLYRTQVLVAPRSRVLARAVMEVIDRCKGEPLEWVVVCRRV